MSPFVLLTMVAVVGGAASRVSVRPSRECLPLLPERVRLDGAPQLQLFAGAPGYGETPGRDASDTIVVFALDSAVVVCAEPAGRANPAHPATPTIAVQLIGAPRTIRSQLGYGATVYGRLTYAELGPHHVPVVCYVDSVPVPGAGTRFAQEIHK